uniref:Methyltransferase like 15 n=1 Tax=Saimiri boliviensis boliviensis TaxID=39432 RepID=A0A2K6TE02_SAIBB
MLQYPYCCRMHKECLSCWLESGIPNLDRDFEMLTKLHIPVMVDEVGHCLSPQKGQIFLDMTFAILQKESHIVLYALDRNPTAYALAEHHLELSPKQIRAMLGQYSQAEALLMTAGVQPGTFDGVLMDLGCSYMQLDTPKRGFSLQKDSPLDMRMDSEKHAKKIASATVQACSVYPITRTQQPASVIPGVFSLSAIYARKDLLQQSTHIATETSQALRIFVNNELNELYTGLKTAQKFLRPGDCLLALSFHSLEDRIVRRFLLGISMKERFNLRVRRQVMKTSQLEVSIRRVPLMWDLIHKKVLNPQDKDVEENPRRRSAKLRAAIKL